MKKRQKGDWQSLQDLLIGYDFDKKKYISQEFQDYGYRLAEELSDVRHKSLYIKLAKETEREMLEEARTFVKDASNVRSKGRLFMWALAKLRRGEPLYETENKNAKTKS